MKLLQLTSDNPKFKTLNFKDGLNIVVGTQLTDEQKKTINGLGKSLSLSLIHYMFGSKFKTSSEKKLEQYLSEYGIFELSFIHNNQEYTIKKDFSKSEFYINDEKIAKTSYTSKLTEIFLGKDSEISFKQVFNCFSRRFSSEVSYYSNVLTQQGRPLEDYYQKMTNLFLLGVNLSLVKRNFDVKDKLSKLKSAEKTLKEYEKKLDKNNINDIKDEINRLKEQLDKFIIAENYDSLKQEADILTQNINDFRNKIYIISKKIRMKELNLESSENIDIDIEKIKEIYDEANFFFEERITKRLEEAQEFHNNLIQNRKKRLSIELNDLNIDLIKLEQNMQEISTKRDSIIKDLDSSGALEERDSLKDRIKTLEEEQKNLEKYEHILNEFKKDKVQLEMNETIIKKESLSYLEKNHNRFEQIEQKFRGLVKRFYDNTGGSLKIVETPTARYLFDISSDIPKQGSQGVGEVKIFCYDILLYLLNPNLLDFLSHDGCIFSEMDKRQKTMIFKLIIELVQNNSLQYFINVGDSTLNEILDKDSKINILTDEEKKVIESSIILELNDIDPKNWLFGESFN